MNTLYSFEVFINDFYGKSFKTWNKVTYESIFRNFFFISFFINFIFASVKLDLSIKLENTSEPPWEEGKAVLSCNDDLKIDSKNINSYKWYKNDEIISNLTSTMVEGNKLIFNNSNHLIHNGDYECGIELINYQIIKSNNNYSLNIHCNSNYS